LTRWIRRLEKTDLAPRDLHLFIRLKRFLAAERFSSDDDVKTAVQHWVKTLATDFFDEGIQKLVPRYDKCFSLGGDYVEKDLKLVKIKKCLKCCLSIHLQPIVTYFMDRPRILFSWQSNLLELRNVTHILQIKLMPQQ
jgi:hypothetical protein